MKCVTNVAKVAGPGNGQSSVSKRWPGLVTILALLLVSRACLADEPQLMVQMREGQTAGRLPDGRLLATGTVIYNGPHTGFRVWSEGGVNGAPQKVTLTGRRDSTHRMNVRLTGKDWQPDAEKGRGIVLHTDRQSAIFSVELDGAQDLPVDGWPLQLRAVVLLP
ncbi:AfaD family invasin [Enterobacter asburiae]